MLGQRKVIAGDELLIGKPSHFALRYSPWERPGGSCCRPQVRRRDAEARAAPVGEPAALLLEVGKAQDRVDQVIVGRELERIDAGPRQALAQLGLAPFGHGLEALAKAGVV